MRLVARDGDKPREATSRRDLGPGWPRCLWGERRALAVRGARRNGRPFPLPDFFVLVFSAECGFSAPPSKPLDFLVSTMGLEASTVFATV